MQQSVIYIAHIERLWLFLAVLGEPLSSDSDDDSDDDYFDDYFDDDYFDDVLYELINTSMFYYARS